MMAVVGSSHTDADLLDFFPEANGDGLNITWAHAVNSKAELEHSLEGDAMMLETDLIVRGMGTTKPTSIPVHAHPPATDSDITFEEWIDRVIQVPNKGIKLDFKCLEAVEPTLKIINQRKDKINVPILLNADIAVGPNSAKDPVDASKYIQICNLNFSKTAMSLGFTTFWNSDSKGTYTWEMIFDLLLKVHDFSQPVTFPIRAVFLSTSWQRFVWLLGLKQSFSITVWSHASDDVDMMGLLALRKHGGKGRVFFDLPECQMTELQKVLSVADDASIPTSDSWNLDLWHIDQSKLPQDVFCCATGIAFLTINPSSSISQRVYSKQVWPVTETSPFEVSGKIQFVDNKCETDGDTQLRVCINCSDQTALDSNSSTAKDLLHISISSSGSVCLQNVVSQISTDASLPSHQIYRFIIRSLGSGHTPTLKVTCGQSDISADECLDSVSISLPDRLMVASTCTVNSFCVSFSKVGTSKDLLVENFVVKA